MANSRANIKAFLASSGTRPPLTDSELDDILAWVKSSKELDRDATPDDLADAIYQTLTEQAVSLKRSNLNVQLG